MSKDPPVTLHGEVARNCAISGDGSSQRLKLKPRPGAGNPGRSWPKDDGQSPWLMPLPFDLLNGQSFLTDGKTGTVKQKPRPSSGFLPTEDEVLCKPPEAVSISCDIANPIPPHSTVVVTSVWNAFSFGVPPTSLWGTGNWSVFFPGVPLPRFFWEIGGFPLTDAGDFSGTRTAIMTIQDFTAAKNGTYTIHASNPCGTASQDILLTT